jgi:hypothetical protein
VTEGVTGLFFEEQSAVSVIEATQRFKRDAASFRIEDLRHNAQRFRKARFLGEFKEFVEHSL